MEGVSKPASYRLLIDDLVDKLRHGQGQVGPGRARRGVWNQNARPDLFPDQAAINELLARLSLQDREIIAQMLEHQVEAGMFEALKALEELFSSQNIVRKFRGDNNPIASLPCQKADVGDRLVL